MRSFIKSIREFVLSLIKKYKEKTETKDSIEKPKPKADFGLTEVLVETERYLMQRYEFRFNVLTEVNEFRERGSGNAFALIDQRQLNSFCLDARLNGINCWDRDISRLIHSLRITEYHPFEHYINQLPAWDGVDRVTAFSQRISTGTLWVESFHRWLLALTAQWMGVDCAYGNSVAPVLVSQKQGKHKSTFCRMILPPELRDYYTDSFDVTSVSGSEQKLAMYGLINLDELDKFNARKMALLKNLMQMAKLSIRKAYKKNFRSLPRVASFIATSNQKELLTDPTGSRRFLCVEVEEMIDCTPLDYTQFYAQLKAELKAGERYWFTSEEEARITENNAAFQKRGMEFDLFFQYFRPAITDEKEGFSAAYIELI